MDDSPKTLHMYCMTIAMLYNQHDFNRAEGFLRSILFDAYKDGLDSDVKPAVKKAVKEEIKKLHSFDEKLCKKDTSGLEKFICKHCEYRSSEDSEVS